MSKISKKCPLTPKRGHIPPTFLHYVLQHNNRGIHRIWIKLVARSRYYTKKKCLWVPGDPLQEY